MPTGVDYAIDSATQSLYQAFREEHKDTFHLEVEPQVTALIKRGELKQLTDYILSLDIQL